MSTKKDEATRLAEELLKAIEKVIEESSKRLKKFSR